MTCRHAYARVMVALLLNLYCCDVVFEPGVQAHDSAAKQEEETAWEAERHESKYARTLEQLPATKKVI